MTFRELAIGDSFRYPDGLDRMDVERKKEGNGSYSLGGWTYFVEAGRRDFEVIRIDTPKEEEK